MAAAVGGAHLLCYCLTFASIQRSLQCLCTFFPTEEEVAAHPIISGLEMQGGWILLVVKTFTVLLKGRRCFYHVCKAWREGCEVSE